MGRKGPLSAQPRHPDVSRRRTAFHHTNRRSPCGCLAPLARDVMGRLASTFLSDWMILAGSRVATLEGNIA
jgi:hypothetical protein